MKYILDANGDPQPCDDVEMWAQWFDRTTHTHERVIAWDRHEARAPGEPEILISTVFLGLDHNWGGGPPILWETLVFGGPLDGEMDRYHTRSDALTGHQAMCRRVIAAI